MKTRRKKKFQKYRKAPEVSWADRNLRLRVIDRMADIAREMGCLFSARNTFEGTPHWFWDDHRGRRILNYWPTSKSYWDPESGHKGEVGHINEVFEIIETIFNERIRA